MALNETKFPDCRTMSSFGETVEFCVSIIYGSVSLLLYYFEVRAILKEKKFHHPFFFQFVYLAFLNVLFWLMVFTKQRIITSPIFCPFFYPHFIEPSLFLHPIMLINFTGLVAQLLCVIIITVNRMTVIVCSQGAEQFWFKNWGKVLSASFILSCIIESHAFPIPVSVNVKGGRLSTIFNADMVWPYVNPVYSVSIVSFSCLLVIFVSTLISIVALKEKKVQARIKAAQINMFWTSFCFSVTTSFVMLYMVVQSLFATNADVLKFLYTVRGWMYDLNCLAPAWMLFITNKRLRSTLTKKPLPIIVRPIAFSQNTQ